MHAWLTVALILFAAKGTVFRFNFSDKLVFGSLTSFALMKRLCVGP
jgi:hypothetical protein